MPSKLPAILIIHGAYLYADIWDDFRAQLFSAGFESACPQLPSEGDGRSSSDRGDLQDDALAIQKAARNLIAIGHAIIVIAHSYGGVVACEALTPDLFAKDPGEAGIIKTIFLSAYIPQPGFSLTTLFEKHKGWYSNVNLKFTNDGAVYPTNVAETFWNDINEIDPDEANRLASRTTLQNSITQKQLVSQCPWKTAPSTFILCKRDEAILPILQKMMVAEVLDAGGKMTTIEIDAAHCPFLSKPKLLLNIVKEVSEDVSG